MNRILRWTIMVALLAIVASVSWIGYNSLMGGSSTPIPLLKGGSVVEAMQTLERMGIKARIEQEESLLPQGTVISQYPEPGMKMQGDKAVTLKVSRGTVKRPLPDLRGLSATDASQRLEGQGFIVGDLIKIYSDRPAGTVIAQEPAAPVSVSPSQKINLLVSLGPTATSNLAVVPDLVEKNVSQARALLAESGFRVRVDRTYTKNSPEGMVLAITPRPGSSVARNSEIVLSVASMDRSLEPAPVAPVDPVAQQPADGQSPEAPATGATTPDTTTVTAAPVQPVQTEETPPPAGGSDKMPLPPGVPAFNASDKVPPQPSAQPITPTPAGSQQAGATTPQTAPQPAAGGKVARIRYQVPPVKDMTLRIEMLDANGSRDLLNRKARSGETVSLNAPYKGEAVVTIFLGGEFVWQDRYK